MSAQTQTVLQILAFLGTTALVGIGVLATIAFTLAGRRGIAAAAAGGTGVAITGYAVALLVVGAVGRERVLPLGEAKVFCEIDCHLAYTVKRVHIAPVAGRRRLLVTLRTYFDERTIAPWRGDAPLRPNPRRVRVVDDRGHAWDVDAAAQRALADAGLSGTPLDTPLRPGESYATTLAFDVPPEVESPRLELTEADAVTRLLVGHENSPLHGKTLLDLSDDVAVVR